MGKKVVKRKLGIDFQLLSIVLALLGYGLAVLYSASTVTSFNNFGNTSYYITHQFIYGAVLGLAAMYIISKIDYHVWQKYLPLLIFASLILLALVKVPGLGFASGGATRWLHIGPLLFQPAEVAKIVIIFYLAAWADKRKNQISDFSFGLLPSLVIVGLYALLILWQPDLGTMLVLLLVAFAMLLVAGMS